MFGIPAGLTGAIVYMLACDESTGRELFKGFSNWINRRHGGDGRTSLVWYGEIIVMAFEGRDRPRLPYWELTTEETSIVEPILFDTVDEFLALRQAGEA
jgi:hypothetical protein